MNEHWLQEEGFVDLDGMCVINKNLELRKLQSGPLALLPNRLCVHLTKDLRTQLVIIRLPIQPYMLNYKVLISNCLAFA